jgi:ferredoxin
MQAQIDRERCQGHGRCAFEAPELFGLDDDGLSFVRRPATPDDEEAVRRAVLSCPEQAITLHEETGE